MPVILVAHLLRQLRFLHAGDAGAKLLRAINALFQLIKRPNHRKRVQFQPVRPRASAVPPVLLPQPFDILAHRLAALRETAIIDTLSFIEKTAQHNGSLLQPRCANRRR